MNILNKNKLIFTVDFTDNFSPCCAHLVVKVPHGPTLSGIVVAEIHLNAKLVIVVVVWLVRLPVEEGWNVQVTDTEAAIFLEF